MHFRFKPRRNPGSQSQHRSVNRTAVTKDNNSTFSTAYLKWNSDSRSHLIPGLRYAGCPRNRRVFWVPKLGHHLEISILEKCKSVRTTMANFTGRSRDAVFYRTTGGLYWKVFTDFAPAFYVNGVAGSSSRETHFKLTDAQFVKPAVAVLSSDVFWWWYTITSNLRDLNPSDWKSFPVPDSVMNDPEICELGSQYIVDLQTNSTMLVRNQRSTGRTETQSFKVKKSKSIIDRIDKVLAMHYGFDGLWCMDLRISISGSASVFESLSCLSSSTHRVATISPEPSTGS